MALSKSSDHGFTSVMKDVSSKPTIQSSLLITGDILELWFIFDKRKRNNAAAKKSRDTRKARYVEKTKQIAILENENAMLKDQSKALKCEIQRLNILLEKKDKSNF